MHLVGLVLLFAGFKQSVEHSKSKNIIYYLKVRSVWLIFEGFFSLGSIIVSPGLSRYPNVLKWFDNRWLSRRKETRKPDWSVRTRVRIADVLFQPNLAIEAELVHLFDRAVFLEPFSRYMYTENVSLKASNRQMDSRLFFHGRQNLRKKASEEPQHLTPYKRRDCFRSLFRYWEILLGLRSDWWWKRIYWSSELCKL